MKILSIFFVLSITASVTSAEPIVVNLWSDKPPGFQIEGVEGDTSQPGKGMTGGKAVIRLGHVSKPQIHVYVPAADKCTGTTIVVCPGGGYNILAWDLEGTEIAEWLNSIGVTAAVLKYRVPTASLKETAYEPPVQDAQRAISMLRAKGDEWSVKSDRIGILGFSAGGFTAGMAVIKGATRLYPAADDTDKQACNPNFGVLIYPWRLWDEKKGQLHDYVQITKDTAPIFFAHAANDGITCENSIQTFLALKKAGVKGSELHIYESGGHGFGTRDTGNPCTTWTQRCEAWLRQRGLLPKP